MSDWCAISPNLELLVLSAPGCHASMLCNSPRLETQGCVALHARSGVFLRSFPDAITPLSLKFGSLDRTVQSFRKRGLFRECKKYELAMNEVNKRSTFSLQFLTICPLDFLCAPRHESV